MNILWLKTELLHPVDKGGKIRTYYMLKELKQHHHITYLTLDDGSAAPDALDLANEYAHEVVAVPHSNAAKFSFRFYFEVLLNLRSKLPYFMQKYASPEMRNHIEELSSSGKFDLIVCDFLMPSINMPENVGIPAVLFQHNIEAVIWKRHWEVQSSSIKKRFLHSQWQRTLAYEEDVCRRFDAVITVSNEDTHFITNHYGVKNVYDVPTGVDIGFFRPSPGREIAEKELLFTGSMDWLPNEDAIRWFIDEIFPLIRKNVPDVQFTVVGRDPFPALIAAAENEESVTVTGRVPDVRPFMERAGIYIVPIRIGGGTRLKLYEAMSMELPIVSTTVGAEGLPVSDGRELLLRDTAEDFAKAVVDLILSRDDAERLGKRAADRVRRDFGWAAVAERFSDICEDVTLLKGRQASKYEKSPDIS